MKIRPRLVAAALASLGAVATAETPPLVCYGAEPNWSLELSTTAARLKVPGEEEAAYAGRGTSLAALRVTAWRGRLAGAGAGDLVALLTETACSDGMSDAKRPYVARVSLPDGRLLAGCCRPDTLRVGSGLSGADASAPAGPAPVPLGAAAERAAADRSAAAERGAPAGPRDWADSLQDYVTALRSCLDEALRAEAVVFAEKRANDKVHLVLRLAGARYADCDVWGYGPPRVVRRAKNEPLKPEEQAVVLTLLPGAPPRGACNATEPAVDERGNPFGWLTRKSC
jgi:uncharacterized membrane protein